MVTVRRARPEDAGAIRRAHEAAIRVTCRSHYTAEEVDAWAGRVGPDGYADDVRRREIFVALEGGAVVGFGVLDVDQCEVRAVYVHPEAGGHGAGRRLLGILEDTARLRGLRVLGLDASLNAVPFYEAAGWQRERATTHVLGGGRAIACIAMTKRMPPLDLVLRDETDQDRDAVRTVHRAAFGRDAEALLVDRLRAAGAAVVSLVAALDGVVVGHLALSPVTIDAHSALGLGPMGVVPVRQENGIGSRLVEEALARARERGHRAVVVLGHPNYYPRFGFVPASAFGIRWEHPAPDAAFMAAELVPGALAGVSGVVRYRPEFDAV